MLGDLGGGLAAEGRVDQLGLSRAERAVDRLVEGTSPVGLSRACGRAVGDVDGFDRLEDPLALGAFLDGVDRAEEVGAFGRFAAEHVANPRVADIGDERVESVAAEGREQGRVDRLRAVVVLLRRDPRAIPGAAEVAVELRDARGDRRCVGRRDGPVCRCDQVGDPAREQRFVPGVAGYNRRVVSEWGGGRANRDQRAERHRRGTGQQAQGLKGLHTGPIRPLRPSPLRFAHVRPPLARCRVHSLHLSTQAGL